MNIIFNFVRIAAHSAVINLVIMTVEMIADFKINIKGFKAEVTSYGLVNLAQG